MPLRKRKPTSPGRRFRLRLPLRLRMFTLATFTPKMLSTAWRTWVRFESGWTMKT